MRLQICHLSDIHFWTQKNYIDEKKEKICDAILSRAKRREDILFLVSGDIAQSCSEEEYDIALDFFEYLKENLNAKKELQSYFIFVPGNHDAILDVNDYDEENRRNEILSQKDNLEEKKMEYYQTKMCEKQKNFFDFRDLLTDDTFITKVETGNKLLEKFELEIAGFSIFINAFNTSWISQRNEKPSEIFIPKSIYEKTIHKNEGLNITMYHHPSNWMHPDDKIFFDSIIRAKRNFGENYSLEAIRVRILEENELPAEKKISVGKYYRIQVSGNFKQTRKIRGLRGLYLHYCYLLGILPKNRLSISAKQVHVLFREDLLKLNTISKETKLLCHYHIDTAEQLFLLKESLQKKMEQCVEERKHLRYKIRADRPEEEIQEMKEQIKVLTEKIGTLRKEAALCDGIAARSKVIKEKFKMVREEKEKKEEQSHEHIRRSR